MDACHGPGDSSATGETIALVGHPNVGKSTLFEALTGRRVITANYPGTTVEVARAGGRRVEGTVIDSPGLLTFPSRTEDEQATARILLEEPLRAMVQVGDAKNIRRTLLLTVQLAELGIPMVLALNMADEADQRGVELDLSALQEAIGLPTVSTTANRGVGISELEDEVAAARLPVLRVAYPAAVEQAIEVVSSCLPGSSVAERALALLWLSRDPVAERWVLDRVSGEDAADLEEARSDELPRLILGARLEAAESLAGLVTESAGEAGSGMRAFLGRVTAHPVAGLPFLAAALLALYWFVGVFGAGTLVGWLEGGLFGEVINPALIEWAERLIPVALISDFFVGEYGLWTMGITYAFALILPIVTTFFIAFGVLEDSGYLPRLAVLTNRVFRAMGLNGRAVVPMVLGLGCVTMATMTTRILESRRERFLVILLLALGVPCSAQLGVVMGMLGGISLTAVAIWAGVVAGLLIVVGWIAAKVMPGERSSFITELPPLRRPALRPVVVKTVARVEWYLREVVPLFLIGSALLFVLDATGALDWLIEFSEPLVVGWLGLPSAAAAAFLMGFFRRDFGATGLFVIASAGLMTAAQVVVAMTTITLFVPCVASVLVIAKERGWRVATGVTLLVFPLAIAVGGLVERGLGLVGWGA
ncbi:MAG: ferrous iron transport protein B [Acidimicrobiia bacterium]|nr:ferrous iron transport protein B [Acidimicrobiia bacterium]